LLHEVVELEAVEGDLAEIGVPLSGVIAEMENPVPAVIIAYEMQLHVDDILIREAGSALSRGGGVRRFGMGDGKDVAAEDLVHDKEGSGETGCGPQERTAVEAELSTLLISCREDAAFDARLVRRLR